MRTNTATIADGGERVGDRVHVVELPVDEDRNRGRPAQKRRGEEPALERDRVAAFGRLPRCEREQQHRAGPERVQHRSLGVATGRVQVHEQAVGQRDHPERDAGHGPGLAGMPARDGEDEDHDREQHQVGGRVGEVDDHRRRAAVRVPQDDFEHDRGADGAGRERRDHAVEPDAPVEARDPRAHEQCERGVAARVEREVEAVADRDGRRAAPVDEVEAEVADREREDADAEHGPRQPLVPLRRCAEQAARGRHHLEAVVDPTVGEVVERLPAEPEREMRDEEPVRDHGDGDPRAHCDHAWPRPRRGQHGNIHPEGHRPPPSHPLGGLTTPCFLRLLRCLGSFD